MPTSADRSPRRHALLSTASRVTLAAVLPAFVALDAFPAATRRAAEKSERGAISEEGLDPALLKSFEAIREAFRASSARTLQPILPLEGKVLLAARAIAPDAGYYSRDQILALLHRALTTYQTERFIINLDLAASGGEDAAIALCPAAWSYRDRGHRMEMSLRFILVRSEGRWTLREIRETR
jgi:hypothetical protein